MASVDITGAVKAEEVPAEARTLMQRGVWIDTAEQIAKDRKRGLVTVITVRAKTPQEVEAEFRRIKNGLMLPIRKHGLKLSIGIVRDSPTEARCYMQTVEIEPPSQRRNGRAR